MNYEMEFQLNRILYVLKKNLNIDYVSLEIFDKVYKIGCKKDLKNREEFFIKEGEEIIGKLTTFRDKKFSAIEKLTIDNQLSFIKQLFLISKTKRLWETMEKIRNVGSKILESFSLDIGIETLLNIVAKHLFNIMEGIKFVKIHFKLKEEEFFGLFGDKEGDNIITLSYIEKEPNKFTKIYIYFDKKKALKGSDEILSSLKFITHVIHSNIKEFISEKKLKELSNDIIRVLVESLEAKDPFTKGHSSGVALYAVKISDRMGFSKDRIEKIRIAAMFHDIGKIAISDTILKKASGLSMAEFEKIRRHPEWSYRILSKVDSFKEVATWARFHHERIDGSGYPFGLKGDEIPVESQIIAISDAIESMISGRPYSKRKSRMDVIKEIEKFSGKYWREDIAKIAIDILKEEEENYAKKYLVKNT